MSIFDPEIRNEYVERINLLTEASQPKWGKMDVTTMLVHCSKAYEDKKKKLSLLNILWLRLTRKKIAVGNEPYRKNLPNPRAFDIITTQGFEAEKEYLINRIEEAANRGEDFYEGKEHSVFGKLSAEQWSLYFLKHLDHHLQQFGV